MRLKFSVNVSNENTTNQCGILMISEYVLLKNTQKPLCTRQRAS